MEPQYNEEGLTLPSLLFIIIVGIVLLFAVLSNGMVIYCVIRLKKLRTVTNIFICNLSASDILLAGVMLPQRLHDVSHSEEFYEGEYLCKIVNFGPVFIITSSIYTLVCVSFERHRVIIDSHKKRMNVKIVTVLIICIWLFALAISVPTLLEYTVHEEHATIGNNTTTFLSCGSQFSREFSLGNAAFVFLVSYIIPVILMLKNYIQVAVYVWRKGETMRANSTSVSQNAASFLLLKHRVRLVKLLIAVAIVFAVSWLPFFIMLLYAKETGNDSSEDAGGFVNLLLIGLASFSTAYNVVLYVMFNPSFKRGIASVLRCADTSDHSDKDLAHEQTNTVVSPDDVPVSINMAFEAKEETMSTSRPASNES